MCFLLLLIVIIIIIALVVYFKKEKFTSEPYWSSLYITNNPDASDYKLFDYLQKLKMNNSNPIWNGIFTNQNSRDLFVSPKTNPVFIVPGIGSIPIYEGSKQVWPSDLETFDKKNMVVPEFGIVNTLYMNDLINALKAIGYSHHNIFQASYNFIDIEGTIVKWCENFKNLIEKQCSLQGFPAIIIGHDLGSILANFFLVSMCPKWKDTYIKSFITINGAIGGCPKAFKTYFQDSKKFDGVKLMMPDPIIYANVPLFSINQIMYTAKDIPTFVEMSPILKRIKESSMKAPGVVVHILAGTGLNTQSSYHYSTSLNDVPDINEPFYSDSKTSLKDYFLGDNTMPKPALEYPIYWTKMQNKHVYYRFFVNAGHIDILSRYEPIKYVVDAIKKY